jgi:hypothetical protein
MGVRPGYTVGVLDWDSNRFLEAFFAVPMMGAVLQTVNVRLLPEQIAYTINHAGSSVLLVNDDFVPLLQDLMPQLPNVTRLVAMSDHDAPRTGNLSFAGEYEALLAAALPLPGLRREYPGNHVLHERHNGPAQGRLLLSSAGGSPLLVRVDLFRHKRSDAGESAKFQVPFINLALVPEFGSSYSLPARIGHLRAAELFLLGEPFTAARAAELGLVTRVVPDRDLLATATATAQKLAAKPNGALRASKRLIKQATWRWVRSLSLDRRSRNKSGCRRWRAWKRSAASA